MRTVAQYRKARADRKRKGVFHIGHFPIGTVVEVESPCGKYIAEEDRIHPDEMYARVQHTVSGVVSNGPNSWLIQLSDKCRLGDWIDAINIQWVRRIVKRGDGTLPPELQVKVDAINAKREARLAELVGKQRSPYDIFAAEGGKGRYSIAYVDYLIDFYLNDHPKYKNRPVDHLICKDTLRREIFKHIPPRGAPYTNYTINKKRFAKVFEAAFRRSFVSRRVQAGIEDRLNQEQYARDMERELESGFSY